MFRKELSNKLLKMLGERNMTVETLSEAVGMTERFMTNVVNRKQSPSIKSLEKICSALEVTPNDLLLSDKTQQAERKEVTQVKRVYHSASKTLPLCPNCNKALMHDRQAYCQHCGQRLGWKDYTTAELVDKLPTVK